MEKKIKINPEFKNKRIDYFILHFLLNLMFLLSLFSFSKKQHRILYNYNSEIHLVINGNGNQTILSSSFYTNPSDVIVNSVSKKDVCYKQCELDEDINYITLIFEEEITSCENMFNGLSNITEINLTNFDASRVTSMKSMFSSCTNLEKITFGNINTASVKDMEALFNNCKNLKSIDVSNFDTSQVTIMSRMFAYCVSLKIINVSNFKTSKVIQMEDLFAYCSKLILVDISNFDTSSNQNFKGMFFECHSLKFLNLSHLDISSGTIFNYLVGRSYSLIFLNLNNFRIDPTGKGSIDLRFYSFPSYFKLCCPDSVTEEYLFSNLTSSDCTDKCFNDNIKVDITLNQCVEQCDESKFEYMGVCNNLCLQGASVIVNGKRICLDEAPENYYLNSNDGIYRQCYSKCKKCQTSGDETDNNCDACIVNYIFVNDSSLKEKNCYEKCGNYYYLNESKHYFCTQGDSCPQNFKLIKEKGKCIDECYNDDLFKFEFENICYEQCPNGTIDTNGNNKCFIIPTTIPTTISAIMPTTISLTTIIPTTIHTIMPTTIPLTTTIIQSTFQNIITTKIQTTFPQNIPTTITTTMSTSYNIIKEKGEYSFQNHTTEEIYEIIKNEILKDFQKDGEEIVINTTNNYIYQITSSKNELDILNENKNNTNKLSVIDLKNCSDVLIDAYNLSDDTNLIILKYENIVNDANEKSIQYEVYEPILFQKLNLSFCSTVSIFIYIPTDLKEGTLQLYEDLKSQGYNLFDKNDKFYTDICTPYSSQNGTDVLLSDRYNEIYKSNELGCQENCEYSDYNEESEYLKCKCDVVEQAQIETKEPDKYTPKSIATSFVNVLKYSNYKVLKCYKLILTKTTFYKNIGSILSIVYFLGYIFSFIIFCFKRIDYLKIQIQRLYENKQFEINITNKNQIYSKLHKNMNKTKKVNRSNPKIITKQHRSIKETKKIIILNFPPKKQYDINKNNNKSRGYSRSKLSVDITKDIHLLRSKSISFNKGSNSNIKEIEDIKINSNEHIKIKKRTGSKNFGSICVYSKEKEKETTNKNYDDYEFNSMDYFNALELDNRKFFRVYWSLIKREHLIIFTFCSSNDYNIFSVKLSKLFFLICTDMALNMFFFSDDSMHNIYQSGGKYNFIEQIFELIISTLVSQTLQIFLNYLTMTDIDYYRIKSLNKNNMNKETIFSIIRCSKYKIIIFYIFTFILFLFYWYVVSAFCAVYENTQRIFITNSLMSFAMGLIYPFIIYFIPTGLRFLALSSKLKKNLKFIYYLSNIIPFF